MSERVRTILTAAMVVFMAAAAFLAGYLAREVQAERARRAALSVDQFNLFWEAWDRVQGSYLDALPDGRQVTYGAIRGALQALNDPYTVFLEPVVRREESEKLRGNYGGIGATLSRDEATGQVLLEPLPGNPAAEAGILSGDILLAVDDAPVQPDETVGAIAERIKGEVGQTVTLTVIHPGTAEPVAIAVVRREILIPSVTFRLLRDDPSIGYIHLTRFSGESSAELTRAVQTLQEQGASRFVLDLRDNGGGLLEAAVAVSGVFMNGQVVYHQVTRTDGERTERTGRSALLPDAPLVVLVNGGTASAAEIVAGALQDNGRAALIGQRTYGKGSVQLVYDLSDGSSVHVTWARWLTPNRNQIDQNGLTPAVAVTPTQAALDAGLDEALERAVDYLNGRG